MIYELIFTKRKNINEDSTPEPYEYYTDRSYIYEESSSWYHDYYLIGGCIIILLSLIGYSYLKWDNDSTIKENIIEIGSTLFLATKAIKDSIINRFNNQRDDSNTDSNNTNDFNNSDNESNLSYESGNLINPETVDRRILTDGYKYRLFKNLHEKETENWPEYGSVEYNKIITKLMNSKSQIVNYSNANLENLIEKYLKNEAIIKNSTPEELEGRNDLIKMHNLFQKTNNEIIELDKNSNDAWIKTSSYDQSYKNDNSTLSTPKASTSQLNNENLTEYQLAKNKAKELNYTVEKDFMHENKSFIENLRGKLKSGIETSTNISSEILELSDDNISTETLNDTKFENINSNIKNKPKSLLESISSFKREDLNKTVSIIQREYNHDGSIKRLLTDTDVDMDINGNIDLNSMTKEEKETLNKTLKTYNLEITDDGFKSTKINNSNNNNLIAEKLAKMRKQLNDSPEKEEQKWEETPSLSSTNESEDISKAKVWKKEDFNKRVSSNKVVEIKYPKNLSKNLPEEFLRAKLPPKNALSEAQESVVQDFDKSFEMFNIMKSVRNSPINSLKHISEDAKNLYSKNNVNQKELQEITGYTETND